MIPQCKTTLHANVEVRGGNLACGLKRVPVWNAPSAVVRIPAVFESCYDKGDRRAGDDNIDIEDGFRGKVWNRCATDVFNFQDGDRAKGVMKGSFN